MHFLFICPANHYRLEGFSVQLSLTSRRKWIREHPEILSIYYKAYCGSVLWWTCLCSWLMHHFSKITYRQHRHACTHAHTHTYTHNAPGRPYQLWSIYIWHKAMPSQECIHTQTNTLTDWLSHWLSHRLSVWLNRSSENSLACVCPLLTDKTSLIGCTNRVALTEFWAITERERQREREAPAININLITSG